MSKQFILADRSKVLELLRRGLCRSIPQENCYLQYTEALVGDLVALTWKMETYLASSSNEDSARSVCEELFIGDRFMRLREEHFDRVVVRRPDLKAFPGDVIVVLPSISVCRVRAADAEEYRRRYLKANKVKVIHVGAMDPVLAAVYGHLDWNAYIAPEPWDIKTLVEKNPGLKLSIYDVLRSGKSPEEAREFQRDWMDGKVELPMIDMSYDQNYGFADPILESKFKSLGIYPRSYREQGELVAKFFGLSH